MKSRKDLLSLDSLSQEEVRFILDTTGPFKEVFARSVKQVPHLRGKTVLILFYEPSTRTATSFELAAKRLAADVISLPVEHSSVTKGESVLDTVETLEAMKIDYIVVRHRRAGIPDLIAKNTDASVINAGDGFHAHPTQGLLDAYTLFEVWNGELQDKRVLIVGDILHSRVARSTSTALGSLGAQAGFLGPGSLVPHFTPDWIRRFESWEEALDWKPDAVYLLRIQKERQGESFFPGLDEYHEVFGLTERRLAVLEQRGTWLLHPGPINRGVELIDRATKYERCLIDKQVENGIATRMSVLYWLRTAAGESS